MFVLILFEYSLDIHLFKMKKALTIWKNILIMMSNVYTSVLIWHLQFFFFFSVAIVYLFVSNITQKGMNELRLNFIEGQRWEME